MHVLLYGVPVVSYIHGSRTAVLVPVGSVFDRGPFYYRVVLLRVELVEGR